MFFFFHVFTIEKHWMVRNNKKIATQLYLFWAIGVHVTPTFQNPRRFLICLITGSGLRRFHCVTAVPTNWLRVPSCSLLIVAYVRSALSRMKILFINFQHDVMCGRHIIPSFNECYMGTTTELHPVQRSSSKLCNDCLFLLIASIMLLSVMIIFNTRSF